MTSNRLRLKLNASKLQMRQAPSPPIPLSRARERGSRAAAGVRARKRFAAEPVWKHLAGIPHVSLALLPTPLVAAPRLSAALGGPQVWIKRDDLTGFGFGGNKVRGLEYLLADALAQDADTLVTG